MLYLTSAAGGGEQRRSVHEQLPDLVEALEEFGEQNDWPGELTFRISLVVDELGQNVIDYAYEGADGGDVEVSVISQDEDVIIEITDQGAPFDPLTDAPDPDLSSPIESRPIGGLGVHFTKTLMDSVEYRRDSDRNCLKIVTRKVR